MSRIDRFFRYSRQPYFIIPRMVLNEMPEEWQIRFISLMEEAYAILNKETPTDYVVFRRSKRGHLRSNDPWREYRSKTSEDAELEDRINRLV